MHHLGKFLLKKLLQIALGPAGQNLGNKGAALGQHVKGEIRGRFAQRHDPVVIGLLVPRGTGGHVGHDHIRLPAQPFLDLDVGVVLHEIQAVQLAAGNRLHLLKVHAKDRANRLAGSFPQRIHPRHGHLAPATGGRAKVNNPCARHQEPEFVVQFQYLVGRTPAIAVCLGAFDVGVIQLALQPQG